ncbi:MAG: OmpA family protein, partial [Rubricella sp.]
MRKFVLALACAVGLGGCAELGEMLGMGMEEDEYVVYFATDSSNLTDEALAAIEEAANRNGGSFDVIGHTDTAGSADYNQNLSQERAEAVVAALLAQGVPAELISSFASGETEPADETGDGVSDPENRRVVIRVAVPAGLWLGTYGAGSGCSTEGDGASFEECRDDWERGYEPQNDP